MKITESGHHQTSGDEKNNKSVSQMNEKAALNQALQQEYHQRDQHLGCPSFKILGTILEMDEGRTSINGPADKKDNDNAEGLISER